MATIEDRDRLFASNNSSSSSNNNNNNSSTNHEPALAMKDLSLALGADSNFRHSTEALRANTTVEHVTISVYSSFATRRWPQDRDEILPFFNAIGCLPKLTSLRILAMSFGFPLELSSILLVETLRNARNLERLKIHGIAIQLEEGENNKRGGRENLATIFRNHPCLSEVSIVRSTFQQQQEGDNNDNDDDNNHDDSFPELFAALSSMPQLENLGIHYRRPNTTSNNNTTSLRAAKKMGLPPTVLADFSRAPKLTQLELFNCDIHEDHLEAFATNFDSFFNLEELSLSFCCTTTTFGWRACQAIAKILATNNSPLQQLYLEPQKKEGGGGGGCGPNVLDIKCTELITNALATDSSSRLRVFVLEGAMVASLSPFVQMLRINCALQVLTIKAIQTTNVWDETEMNYLLKLNEIGRYDLFHHDDHDDEIATHRTSPRTKWIQAIIDSQGDMNCIYFLLSANPILCQVVASEVDNKK